jgi:hypothetical protein
MIDKSSDSLPCLLPLVDVVLGVTAGSWVVVEETMPSADEFGL